VRTGMTLLGLALCSDVLSELRCAESRAVC
jgi:hypothetical protein